VGGLVGGIRSSDHDGSSLGRHLIAGGVWRRPPLAGTGRAPEPPAVRPPPIETRSLPPSHSRDSIGPPAACWSPDCGVRADCVFGQRHHRQPRGGAKIINTVAGAFGRRRVDCRPFRRGQSRQAGVTWDLLDDDALDHPLHWDLRSRHKGTRPPEAVTPERLEGHSVCAFNRKGLRGLRIMIPGRESYHPSRSSTEAVF
jgi:hypothetical protein